MLSKSQLKYIQSLHHKKFREEHACFLVEGTKMLEEAITYAPAQIKHIYVVPEWLEGNRNVLGRFEAETTTVSIGDMAKMSTMQTAPGVLLLMEEKRVLEPSFRGLTLVLDGLQDPGNLGTIIRTADWFGIQNIVCGKGTVDAYNPKVIQSSMGSIFRMDILYMDLMELFDQHPELPIWVSHLNGQEIAGIQWPEDAFLVIGNESKGVSDEIAARADQCIKIPGYGKAESLNASIATAILLYAWKC